MESILGILEWLLVWLVASGVGVWLLRFIAALALLMAMTFVAYVVSENLTRGAAVGALWTGMEIMFFVAPVVAVMNGGWWWAAPPVIAVLHGLLLRVNEDEPGGRVTRFLKDYQSERRSH
ncbi:MAG: hypothetical protein WEB85_11240 [Dongiaceae bacterium]